MTRGFISLPDLDRFRFWKLRDILSKQTIWQTLKEREQGQVEGEGLVDAIKEIKDNLLEELQAVRTELRLLKEKMPEESEQL